MKIGFYSPYLDTYGGGERYMLTLAAHLSKKNSVDVFWNDQSIKATLTRFLKIDLSTISFRDNIFEKKLMQKLIRTKNYELLFVLSDGSIPLTIAPKNILHFQVPFKFETISIFTKLKLKRYQHIIVNSHFTKSFIDQSFHADSKVIYPPVDIKSLKREKKENTILSVGRFSDTQLHPKKQEVLIDVFKELSKEATGWKLILAGQVKKSDQKYLRYLKKICRGYAISVRENLSSKDLRKLYSHASIYWHATGFGEDEQKNPERVEHFGIATVEASAAGAAPVVINKGGQKEIITNGENGLLWNTKTDLYNLTMQLIKDKSLREKISNNAQKSSKRFSVEKFTREYDKLIF